jgi:polyhydroxybutyrate depolymerase
MRAAAAALWLALLVASPIQAATISLWHDGLQRSAELDRPRDRAPAPLLVVLHGAMLNGATMRGLTDLPAAATEAGAAVAWPDAHGPVWNDGALAATLPGVFSAPDDVGFIDALIDRLVATGVADPDRVHLVGVSNGGMMAFAHACRGGARIASLAVFKATMAADAPRTCRPGRPLPVLMAAGTADPIVRWDGRVVLAGLVELERRLPVPDGFALWLSLNRCVGAEPYVLPARRADGDAPFIRRHTGLGCPGGATTVLYEIVGGGHRLPGGEGGLLFRALGRASPDADAARLLLDFVLPLRRR